MNIQTTDLIQQLVEPRLRRELAMVITVIRRGYNVALRVDRHEAVEVVMASLLEEAERCLVPIRVLRAGEVSDCERMSMAGCGLVVVFHDSLPCGLGFVFMTLPSSEKMMPSCHVAVLAVIERLGKRSLLDVFDAEKMRLLKEVMRRRGALVFIDAVVQVLFLAEVEGNDRRSVAYLGGLCSRATLDSEDVDQTESEVDSGVGARFFEQILARHRHPHIFAKTALSYFVVNGLGYSTAQAARVLNISRTTLQEHLRIARGCGVQQYFGDFCESKVI